MLTRFQSYLLTLAKTPSPETTPNTIKRLAQRCISPNISSAGSEKRATTSAMKMEKTGQTLPPMAAPSNPKMMIHHSLALSLRTRCRGTTGISLSHSSCTFSRLCSWNSEFPIDSTEVIRWRLTGLRGPLAFSCWEHLERTLPLEWLLRRVLLLERILIFE